jgi:hypothetical protein
MTRSLEPLASTSVARSENGPLATGASKSTGPRTPLLLLKTVSLPVVLRKLATSGRPSLLKSATMMSRKGAEKM